MAKKFQKIDFVKKEFKEEVIKQDNELSLDELLTSVWIDPDKDYVEPPIYLGVKDDFDMDIKRLCTPGNISAIMGKYKSKKSFFQAMLAAAATQNYNLYDKIIPRLPDNKRQILIFDTEQSIYDVYRVQNRVQRLCQGASTNLGVFSLRGMEADNIIKLIDHALIKFPQTGMMFIDQIADLAKSINDEPEAVKIVRYLERITKENDMHICCVIHQNKGDNYASGWLGSQIMKKAETVISVDVEPQNKDVSHITGAYLRSKGFEPFSIQINSSGLPEILGKEAVEQFNTDMPI